MNDSKPSETIKETYTVDVNQVEQRAKVTSEKHKIDFLISKPRVAPFFSVRTTKGSPPVDLAGKFTSLEKAIETVVHFINTSKETFAVKSDRLHQERQQRKHAESESTDS